MDSGLTTQFTEDLPSHEATICDRKKCKAVIAAGEDRHYIAGYNSQSGKFVCTKCIERYRAQPGTMSRKKSEAFSISEAGDIRKMVNAGRKKGATVSERRITAVGHGSTSGPHNDGYVHRSSMLPPSIPGQSQPQVMIPTTWGQSSFTHPPPAAWHSSQPYQPYPMPPPSSYGYSSAHALYPATRQSWASRAYQGTLPDLVTVKFKLMHEIPTKANAVLVRNIWEGKPVDVNSTPPQLRQLAINALSQRVHSSLKGFPIQWGQLPLREVAHWIDLGQEPSDIPYFLQRCLKGKAKGKDGVPTFKKPTRDFDLALVIDSDYWDEIIQYLNEVEMATDSHGHNSMNVSEASQSRSRSPDTQSLAADPSGYRLSSASFDTIQSRASNFDSLTIASKRTRSDSQSVPKTPPQSKRRALPAYESPNRDQLREALVEGGSSLSQVSVQARTVSERIEFFQISHRPLKELLASNSDEGFQGFICDPADAAQGSLVIVTGKYLGIGTFKTAQLGYLSLIHLTSEGLGTTQNQRVAAKRMYVRRAKRTVRNPDGWALTRLTAADEFAKTMMEANVLLWAVSLMTFTYSFIDHFIANSPSEPPFDIPEVRFVHAAIAVVPEQVVGPVSNSKSTICRSYLVEELIDETRDGFHKFINNASAVPVSLVGSKQSLSIVAEFLSFTQHVQYHKSGGMVYLSDLQGTSELLTDPQIMTSPSIGDGIEIFGEGNVPSAFEAFPDQHICGKFCEWFQLPKFKPTQ
ncbi:hypothetical protein C8R43DRAFT_1142416 [Mycena crocata]|nr:hypothetical protein C8R43DRAFT_1142415 [Mycena crocata]KAJ7086294.1 hypothetical protein C8R43DRAFT_1142416 [Mycena crocata]